MVNENFLSRQKNWGHFLPFLVQNLAIFAQKSSFGTFSSKPHSRFVQNWHFWFFWPITSKRCYESSQFLVLKLFLWSSLRKSYSICLENSDMVNFWPFKSKIWPLFGQKWQFWKVLTYNFQTPLWIFLIFCTEVVFMVFFEKIILYIPGKFWCGEILAI